MCRCHSRMIVKKKNYFVKPNEVIYERLQQKLENIMDSSWVDQTTQQSEIVHLNLVKLNAHYFCSHFIKQQRGHSCQPKLNIRYAMSGRADEFESWWRYFWQIKTYFIDWMGHFAVETKKKYICIEYKSMESFPNWVGALVVRI